VAEYDLIINMHLLTTQLFTTTLRHVCHSCLYFLFQLLCLHFCIWLLFTKCSSYSAFV